MNYFQKSPLGAPLHTLSILYDISVGCVTSTPPASYKAYIALFEVAEWWLLFEILCYVLFLQIFIVETSLSECLPANNTSNRYIYFAWNIFYGCNMPTENTDFSGHLVLYHFGTCNCSSVGTNHSQTCRLSGLLIFLRYFELTTISLFIMHDIYITRRIDYSLKPVKYPNYGKVLWHIHLSCFITDNKFQ